LTNSPLNFLTPSFWRELWRDVRLAWNLARDPRVPFRTKAIPLLAVAYIVSPFDIVPGFIPLVGQLDDFAILLLGIRAFIHFAPQPVVQEHRSRLT